MTFALLPETITLQPGVTVQGAPGQTAVINGAGTLGPLVIASGSDITATAVLSGFMLVNADNTNGAGGALYIAGASPRIINNVIVSNTAGLGGGGYLTNSEAVLINNVIADNQANTAGSGLYIQASTPHLLHTTVARNTGGDGSGIYVTQVGTNYSRVALTNTILVGHAVGLTVTEGSTVTLAATLWGAGNWSNTTDWGGAGTVVTGTMNVWDAPGFVDPDTADYHLDFESAAIDAGLNAGVSFDLDGRKRIAFPSVDYDIGADEYETGSRFVASSGNDTDNDCSVSTAPCQTIQHAVDQALVRESVLVASGVYAGVQQREGTPQVVYISKTIAVYGGFTTTNWTIPYPLTQPTTLDAQGEGRVLYITGNISPLIEGLHITGGNADGLGGSDYGGADAGGGVYIITATAVVNNNWLFNNDGGLYGGGIHTKQSNAIIQSNHIFSNTADYNGGGMYIFAGTPIVSSNWISGNSVLYSGGGIFIRQNAAIVQGNHIMYNMAGYGGGVFLYQSSPTFFNNVVADNHASSIGSGIYIGSSSAPQLSHTTIARNTGGGGSGIYVVAGGSSSAILTNTILVSHTIGIAVGNSSAATLMATLWGSGEWGNMNDWSGGGTILTGTLNDWGDPAFTAPDSGDYHITAASAALDQGITTTVSLDMDGQARPADNGYDIGADEYYAASARIMLEQDDLGHKRGLARYVLPGVFSSGDDVKAPALLPLQGASRDANPIPLRTDSYVNDGEEGELGSVMFRTADGTELRLLLHPDGELEPYPGVRVAAGWEGTYPDITYVITQANQHVYRFDRAGRPLQSLDPYGNVISYTHDVAGQLTAVTDVGSGRSLQFNYDTIGQLTVVTDPLLARAVRFGYNIAGELTVVTDTRGFAWHYTYTDRETI